MSDATSPPAGSQGGALAALVVGLLGVAGMALFALTTASTAVFYLSIALGIVAIVIGAVALKKRQSKAMSILGIVAGSLVILAALATFAFALLFLGVFTAR